MDCKRISKISKTCFLRLFGVSREKLKELVKKCERHWQQHEAQKKLQGRPYEIGTLQQHIMLMLLLYRCHITQEFAGVLFEVDKSTVCRSLKRIEEIALPVLKIKKQMKLSRKEAEELIIDCTEQRCEKPQENQKEYYSGKKKAHTLKGEIIVTGRGRIVGVSDTYAGSHHDLTIRRSEKKLPKGSHGYGDSAYQGYDKEHEGYFDYPYKKPKGGELTAEEKEYNRGISGFRVRIEHKIGDIKVFRMMSDRYRYPRKNHNIKLQITAGLVNMNHGF
jgi:hypothetical protein